MSNTPGVMIVCMIYDPVHPLDNITGVYGHAAASDSCLLPGDGLSHPSRAHGAFSVLPTGGLIWVGLGK